MRIFFIYIIERENKCWIIGEGGVITDASKTVDSVPVVHREIASDQTFQQKNPLISQ